MKCTKMHCIFDVLISLVCYVEKRLDVSYTSNCANYDCIFIFYPQKNMVDHESPLATIGLSKSDKELKESDKMDPNDEVVFAFC